MTCVNSLKRVYQVGQALDPMEPAYSTYNLVLTARSDFRPDQIDHILVRALIRLKGDGVRDNPKGKTSDCPARFHELVVDVFKLRIPDLFIVDAVKGMEGNGPASPDLRDVGLVLASDNAVAIDAVIATMMGCDPARIRMLRKANADGLGDYDVAALSIDGELARIPGFKLPPLGGEAILSNASIQERPRKQSLFAA